VLCKPGAETRERQLDLDLDKVWTDTPAFEISPAAS
jgi:hypothetical protein